MSFLEQLDTTYIVVFVLYTPYVDQVIVIEFGS